jgi:hypothetical protein
VILKLNFAKAFDTAEQEATLKLSECLGFDPVDVVKNDYVHRNVFGSFEWCVRKEFYLSEGVWQGDPSSPLFFQSVLELLNAMVNQLFQNGALHAPLNIHNTYFPNVQYADDTLLLEDFT